MNRTKIYCAVWCIVIMAGMIMSNQYVQADTIKGAAIPVCPYVCDPTLHGGKEGFMVDIAKTILQQSGHTLTVEMMPFPRALQWVREGEYDALVIASHFDDPEGELIYPEIETALIVASFVVRKGSNWKYTGIDSLREISLGSGTGYTWNDDAVNQYLQEASFPAVQNVSGDNVQEKNLRKLLTQRIDAFLDDKGVTMYQAANMGIAFNEQLDIAGQLPPTPHFTTFSGNNPKSAEYTRLLSEGMNTLRSSGQLAEILARYGLEDWLAESISGK